MRRTTSKTPRSRDSNVTAPLHYPEPIPLGRPLFRACLTASMCCFLANTQRLNFGVYLKSDEGSLYRFRQIPQLRGIGLPDYTAGTTKQGGVPVGPKEANVASGIHSLHRCDPQNMSHGRDSV